MNEQDSTGIDNSVYTEIRYSSFSATVNKERKIKKNSKWEKLGNNQTADIDLSLCNSYRGKSINKDSWDGIYTAEENGISAQMFS